MRRQPGKFSTTAAPTFGWNTATETKMLACYCHEWRFDDGSACINTIGNTQVYYETLCSSGFLLWDYYETAWLSHSRAPHTTNADSGWSLGRKMGHWASRAMSIPSIRDNYETTIILYRHVEPKSKNWVSSPDHELLKILRLYYETSSQHCETPGF